MGKNFLFRSLPLRALQIMVKRISEALGVASDDLQKEGAFDAFLAVDSNFHIDPALVKTTTTAELSSSYSRLSDYFRNILILASKSQKGDALERGAISRLSFPEIDIAGIGFAKASKKGRAFGKKLPIQIYDTAKTIIRAGITDPVIFELIGLFEEHVGADLISDMVLFVIAEDVIQFNERVIQRLRLNGRRIKVAKHDALLPCTVDSAEPILLLPADILSPLPVATSWDDIDRVTTYNEELRDKLNKQIGITWREATRRIHKRELKRMLLQDPALLRELLSRYKGKPAKPYDFENDPLGEFIWHDAAKNATSQNPLAFQQPRCHEDVVAIIRQICKRFRQLIEHNGLNLLLFDDARKPRPEKFSQLLFFGVADCYCAANNLDLSREANAGRGPVDFKISGGYHSRVNVEIKLSTNKKLVSGYTAQLPAYDAAEQTFYSFFVVVDIGGSRRRLHLLNRVKDEAVASATRAPEIMFVDGTEKQSASKL
jgi:hypothetical protein